jgi:hypothetical protein
VANEVEVEPLHHHHHKMVGFTLGILQRHLTYGYMGKSHWRIQDFLERGALKGRTSEGYLEAPQWVQGKALVVVQRFASGS